ncbi:MAG: plasmid replication, integration and excision activator [Solirubrobacterales bacterium]
MAVSTRIPVQTIDVFPHGAFMRGEVKPAEDFDKRQAGVDDTQVRDKETGQRVWEVMVVDADPEARKGQGEVTVKILADHQPVPPSALDGLPFRPVEFVGLTITPYVDTNRARPRLAYSIRATEMKAPGGAAKAAPNGKAA